MRTRRILLAAVLFMFAGLHAGGAVRRRAVVSPRDSRFDAVSRVFLVILENEDYGASMGQPFLKQLAAGGASLSDFHALTHPSQPNYIALTAGKPAGVADDDLVTVDVPNLADLLSEAGLDWKVYAEDYPGHCYLGEHAGVASSGLYVRRHVPFLSFLSVQTNASKCSRIVNAAQLDADIAGGVLPRFSMYVPNTVNDGHDTGVAAADLWLQNRIGPLLEDPRFAPGTLLIVTFDEGRRSSDNHIYCSFHGAGVRAGAVSAERYDLYDLLRTIEEIFHLGTLGANDDRAKVIDGVWE